VDAGSREENASKQGLEPGSDSIRTDKAPDAHAGGLRRSLSSGGAFREFYAIIKTAYIYPG
jgi:hypothetical protein